MKGEVKMWLAVTVYTDGMDMSYGKFKTKKSAIEYLEGLGYEKCELQFGRRVRYEDYASYAEVIPMDELKTGETN